MKIFIVIEIEGSTYKPTPTVKAFSNETEATGHAERISVIDNYVEIMSINLGDLQVLPEWFSENRI